MAWSNHGRHHRSLCREGSAGPPGAVERQRGLSGAGWGGGGSRPGAGDVFWVRGCVCACMGGVHRCAPPGSAGLPPLSEESGGQNVADGSRPPLRGGGQEGLGAWDAPCRVSPGLASSWPSPAGSRSWWYFSCLARIRSILRGAAQAAPELPKAPRDPSAMPGCRALGGGTGGSRVPPQNPLTAV